METQEGNELDDFGDFASEKMGDSMISNKSEKNFFSEEKLASQEQLEPKTENIVIEQTHSEEKISSQEQLEPKSENVQEEVKVETQEGNELDDFGVSEVVKFVSFLGLHFDLFLNIFGLGLELLLGGQFFFRKEVLFTLVRNHTVSHLSLIHI